MKQSLYDILGVDKNATTEEIKQAFRNKAKEHHTDKGGENEKIVAVNKAWHVLKDEGRRKHYDETGQEYEMGFDMKFQSLIQEIFLKIIDNSPNVETKDMVGAFKTEVQHIIFTKKQEREAFKKSVDKFNKIIERTKVKSGENRITYVLGLNIVELEKLIGIIENNLEFFEDCLEVLENYDYDCDCDAPFGGGGLSGFYIQHQPS